MLSEELSLRNGGWLCGVNEEATEAGRETNRGEEQVVWRIYASRGPIGWVEGAGDIGSVNRVVLAQVSVETLEDLVDMFVVTAIIPPSFDDDVIVAEELKVALSATIPGDCVYEQLKGHCLCPSDVTDTFEGLPARNEAPCAPSIADADPNSDFRTCI
jgi:hypothetical protein